MLAPRTIALLLTLTALSNARAASHIPNSENNPEDSLFMSKWALEANLFVTAGSINQTSLTADAGASSREQASSEPGAKPSKYVQEDAEKKTTDKTSTAGDNDDSESPSAEESDGTSVQDTASPETAGRIGVVRRSIFFVDKSQRIASEGFSSFINQVDGFFSNAGADDDDVNNESWARLRLDAVRNNRGETEFDPSLKVRAVLPRTERRFKLLFSTEDEDNEDSERAIGQSGVAVNRNSSLALRFLQRARANGDVNLDLGVRQRNGEIQIFTRLKTTYRTDFAGNWTFNFANNYFYYSKDGYEDRLSFDFRRPWFSRKDTFFRTFLGFNWRNGQKAAVVSQTTGLYWDIDRKRSLAFEILAAYHTALQGVGDRFRGHEIRFRWRHNIWRSWFFYEVWPSVSWPADKDYKKAEGFLLRAEVMFGQR